MDPFKEKVREIFSEEQAAFIEQALDFSAEVHAGQYRETGEPYIIHPIAVASILIDLGLDYTTIAAALMHDIIEDTKVTEDSIQQTFGAEVAHLVMGVTKLDKITFRSKEEEQAENFRRMFFAMAKDIRVMLIKIADRIHNMRTIAAKPLERQIAIATETLEIYAPLASRLGLSYFKCELEDMCFKVLHPDIYKSFTQELPLKRAERQDFVNMICQKLGQMISELGIQGEVSGRPKHYYSIYKKMVRQKKTFDQIYDLTAVRVIVESIKDCYEILGMIHSLWKPIPGRFKDFIAVPKQNNYQSLHTTVMTTFGMPFEIQIRTYEMHRIAEYGIAAHWKYKEQRNESNELDKKIEWLRGVMDVQSDTTTPQEFYESLKFDLHSGQVFIFTPKGDVQALTEGSTPIDFAYSVHSEVGNKCVGAKVNNKMVPLETKLNTGDFVEILTSKNSKGPSRDWLRIVKTTQAKSKIKAFFKKEMKEENIKLGKEMLEKEAKARGYTLNQLFEKKWLDVIMQRYSLSSLNDLYASVAYGAFSVNQILLKLIDFYKKENSIVKAEPQKAQSYKKAVNAGVIIHGYDDLMVRLAKCCNPVPGDEIIGYISRGRGIAVHRTDCSNLRNIEDFRLIAAEWGSHSSTFVVALQVETKNTAGILARITSLVSELKMSIESLKARVDKHNNGIINLMINVSKTEDIDKLLSSIARLPEVDQVYRSKGQ